jgi:hypothetical protein
MIPMPDNVEFDEWASRVAEEFAADGIPYALRWQEFGEQLQNYPSVPPIPMPGAFKDWREWARRCMDSFL